MTPQSQILLGMGVYAKVMSEKNAKEKNAKEKNERKWARIVGISVPVTCHWFELLPVVLQLRKCSL